MFKIENKTIKCTQGDEGTLTIGIKNPDGTDYSFVTGDKIIFSIFEEGDYTSRLLRKEDDTTEGETTCDIIFSSEETTLTDVISEKTTFWYQISLNGTQTFIGFDDENAKKFILYPGGGAND